MDEERDRRGMIAARLDLLFRTRHPEGRGEYSLREVATAVNAKAGEAIVSPSYLSLLRRGLRGDPSYAKLAAIADFFGVGPDFFLDGEQAGACSPEPARALEDGTIATIALRSAGLSENSLRAILAMVESARAVEKLPDSDTPRADIHRPR